MTEPCIYIEPTALPARYLVDIRHLVSVRIEPRYVEEDIYSEPQRGPGGGKKRRKIGTQLVPAPSGELHITITTTNELFRITYTKELINYANELFSQLVLLKTSGQSGVARDVKDESPVDEGRSSPADTAVQSPAEDRPPSNNTPPVSIPNDDPEFIAYMFQCSNCNHIYETEMSDADYPIACERCGKENKPACTRTEYERVIATERAAEEERVVESKGNSDTADDGLDGLL